MTENDHIHRWRIEEKPKSSKTVTGRCDCGEEKRFANTSKRPPKKKRTDIRLESRHTIVASWKPTRRRKKRRGPSQP